MAVCWAAWSAATGADRLTLLAIVWHSRTGASRAMAEAVRQGAGEGARLIPAAEATPAALLAARGYVFVGPENLASLSGLMKEMFDRCY